MSISLLDLRFEPGRSKRTEPRRLLVVRILNEALRDLHGADYYFMVMVNQAMAQERPRGDLLRLIATAVAIVAIVLAIAYFLVGR